MCVFFTQRTCVYVCSNTSTNTAKIDSLIVEVTILIRHKISMQTSEDLKFSVMCLQVTMYD